MLGDTGTNSESFPKDFGARWHQAGPPVYKYCHYCCLPPVPSTAHSVPSSPRWQIFLHLFCLAAHISIPTDVTWPLPADCNTPGKTRTLCKGKTTLRKLSCARRSLTHRLGVGWHQRGDCVSLHLQTPSFPGPLEENSQVP